MFIYQKKCGKIKGRVVYNGKPNHEWINKEDNISSTSLNEIIMLIMTINTHKKQDIMSMYVPNTFIQNHMPIKEGEEKVIMKVRGDLVDWIVDIDPDRYKIFVV